MQNFYLDFYDDLDDLYDLYDPDGILDIEDDVCYDDGVDDPEYVVTGCEDFDDVPF